MKFIFFTLFLLLSFSSCSQPENNLSLTKTIEITGRNDSLSLDKPIIYKIKMPNHWIDVSSKKDESLADTKKPLHEFFIEENEGFEKIKITIHNFPADNVSDRIPPFQQVNRWKKQLEQVNESTLIIKNQSFGGYAGLYFEAVGLMQDRATKMMGWSMQLAPQHFRSLSAHVHPSLENRYKQMRGDVTIKVTGNPDLIQKHREEIFNFARSFQLIDDIP